MVQLLDLARDVARAARFASELVRRAARLALAAVRDTTRPRVALVAENAALRAQLATLSRKARRVTPDAADRGLLVVTSRLVPRWRDVVLIVRPETLLRWHRDIGRWVWAWRSSPRTRRQPRRTPVAVRSLVVDMAEKNPRWGAQRISGELAKVSITVSDTTVERILAAHWPHGQPGRERGQAWSTFVKNHLTGTWACDFFTVTTLTFKQVHAFVVLDLASRRIVHANVTEHPTGEWTTQQLRNAVWDDDMPRRLIRDRDAKYTSSFDAIVEEDGGEVLLTPPRRPVANCYAERLVGSARREVFDHLVPRDEDHARQVLLEWTRHYNAGRPHQGIGQAIPALMSMSHRGDPPDEDPPLGRVACRPVLNGLIHEYSRVA